MKIAVIAVAASLASPDASRIILPIDRVSLSNDRTSLSTELYIGEAKGAQVATKPFLATSHASVGPRNLASAPSAHVIVKFRGSVAQTLSLSAAAAPDVDLASTFADNSNVGALLKRHGVHGILPLFREHLRARRGGGGSEAALNAAIRQRFPVRARRAPGKETPADLSCTYVLDLGIRTMADVMDVIQSLKREPDVLYAEQDKPVKVLYVPNDPSYSSVGSWGQNYDDLYGLKKIGTTQAWDITQGQGVVVAVVDTGIDYKHPDISANIWANGGEIPDNGVDDDHNGFIDDVRGWDFVGSNYQVPVEDNDPNDVYGHGTHVAGIVAATGDNNQGVVGVAWKAKVMAVRALDDTGYGSDSDLARAIIYATDNGADVINASWGGEGFSQTETDAVNYAHAHGVVFVAAAGNSAKDANQFSPANISNAIAVGSLSPFDYASYFSNFGSKVELVAPGEDILSLQAGTNAYIRESGTSMAAPHVSGTAALIIAQHPTLTNEQVRQALRTTATDLLSTGRDLTSGYGRVNAALAILVDPPLEAKIQSPVDGHAISDPIVLTGTVGGPNLDHFILDFGAGFAPLNWTTLRSSTAAVENSEIGVFDSTTVADGIYTIRLRAYNALGHVFEDQIQIHVRYLQFTSPIAPTVPSLTLVAKPGLPLEISGSAVGPTFQGYSVDWAPGVAATSGWSSTGVQLKRNGIAPVTTGVLGSWTPSAELAGYYTLRLSVTNSGFVSFATTTVYLEPSLASNAWPKLAPNTRYYNSPQPVRGPDGACRFIMSGTGGGGFGRAGATLYSFALDGSLETAALDWGSYSQPAIGDLDGQPGDEIVVASARGVQIFSLSLQLLRTLPLPVDRMLWTDQIALTDLDGDGVSEIIVPVRNTDLYLPGSLYVYRADGTLLSDHYPLEFATGIFDDVRVLAADLDGDGKKELIMVFEETNQTSYTVSAFKSDGTPYQPWSTLHIPGYLVSSLSAADLDSDGRSELIIAERPVEGGTYVRVLNGTGETRPGWPVATGDTYETAHVAVADLDRDGRKEIVVAGNSTVSTLRADGTAFAASWSIGGNYPFNTAEAPVIADIDGDGVPEILVGLFVVTFDTPVTGYSYSLLQCFALNGTVKRSWQLFGVNGEQPYTSVPLVGDFNNDGKTDIVINTALIAGGSYNGWLDDCAITYLSIGTNYNSAASDWTSNFHDPQNSRTIAMEISPPNITASPVSRSVMPGNTVIFSVKARGYPIPVYQWQKNKVNIPGATASKLILTDVQEPDQGSYTVVATNAAGMATSNEAFLTVGLHPPSDFNGDNKPDLIWQNRNSGERGFWLMNGTTVGTYVKLGDQSTEWEINGYGDFDWDGQTDLVWTNVATGERKLWLMDGVGKTSEVSLATVGTEWEICGVADFNGDGKPDIVWQNTTSGQRGMWLMNGTQVGTFIEFATVGTEWQICATGDFNGDGKSDIVWQNTISGERGMWLMNGTQVGTYIAFATVGTEWSIVGAADFNADGKTDIAWQNAISGERGMWLMNGTQVGTYIAFATVGTEWSLGRMPYRRAVADFNADNQPDIIWSNTTTGERGFWIMNGLSVGTYMKFADVATQWRIAGSADFNGDSKADIIWESTVTGERGFWIMNGTSVGTYVKFADVGTEWRICGSADFNADSKPDIIWENTVTGERGFWIMNGTSVGTYIKFADVGTQWHICGAADFNGDAKPDIIWENTVTGERGFWVMNGITVGYYQSFATLSTDWQLKGAADFNHDGKPDIIRQNTVTGERGVWFMNGMTAGTYQPFATVGTEWTIGN